jgi:acylphosphatase
MDRVCRRYRVRGKVQGVFFRASTARVAEGLGLVGWARNLPDGSVEVLALGDAAGLSALEDFLRTGPPRARVEEVSSTEVPAAEVPAVEGFRTA